MDFEKVDCGLKWEMGLLGWRCPALVQKLLKVKGVPEISATAIRCSPGDLVDRL